MKRKLLALFCMLFLLAEMIPAGALAAKADISKVIPESFGEGLVKYSSSKNKYGYLDTSGNVVIKAQYLSTNAFRNGLAMVQISKGKYAATQFIDHSGKVVIKPLKNTKTRYYAYTDFWMGDYAATEIWSISKRDGSISPVGYNYVNSKGKLLNGEEYMYVGPFREGYALVGTGGASRKLTRNSISEAGEYWLSTWSGNTSVRAASQYYFIDPEGQQLGAMTWTYARSFSEGMAAVAVKTSGGTARWGYINSSGTLQISPEYAEAWDFHNGLARVSDGENYGYVDPDGNLAVPMIWKSAGDFSADGYAIVKDEYHAHLIDRSGSVVLETEYSSLITVPGTDRYIFNDGFASGMIDRTGAVLIPAAYRFVSWNNGTFSGTRYDNVLMIVNEYGDIITPVLMNGSLISEEQAAAYPDGTPCKKVPFSADAGGRDWNMCVFTDDRGTILSMNMVDSMRGESFSLVRSDGKTLLFDADGRQIGSGEWDGVVSGASNENVICVRKNDFCGFVDAKEGSTLAAPQYTSVTAFRDGTAVAMLGSNPTYLDTRARPVLPAITKNSGKDAVKALQQQLADQGFYTGKVNGSFSKQLTDAISAAQAAFGLPQTGTADSDLQYALRGE